MAATFAASGAAVAIGAAIATNTIATDIVARLINTSDVLTRASGVTVHAVDQATILS